MSDWYTLMGNEVKCGPAIQAQKPFQLKAGAYQLKWNQIKVKIKGNRIH